MRISSAKTMQPCAFWWKNDSLEKLLFCGHRASLLFAWVNPLSSKLWKKNGHSGSYTTYPSLSFSEG